MGAGRGAPRVCCAKVAEGAGTGAAVWAGGLAGVACALSPGRTVVVGLGAGTRRSGGHDAELPLRRLGQGRAGRGVGGAASGPGGAAGRRGPDPGEPRRFGTARGLPAPAVLPHVHLAVLLRDRGVFAYPGGGDFGVHCSAGSGAGAAAGGEFVLVPADVPGPQEGV